MAIVRLTINGKGITALLKSPEVLADLRRRANAIAAAAGEGHDVTSRLGARRARASVVTATPSAKIAEARDHNLTRSIDAGR